MKEGKHKGGNLPLSQSNRKATERLTPGKVQTIYCVSHSVSVATETKRNPKGEISTVIGTRTNPVTKKREMSEESQHTLFSTKSPSMTDLYHLPGRQAS